MFSFMLQVFEFLEDISDNLTDLATRELTILKDLKVGFDIYILLLPSFWLNCDLIGLRERRKVILSLEWKI